MAYYPALHRRLYKTAKDTFPERRNPMWSSAEDSVPSIDYRIYDGHFGPSPFAYTANGSALPQPRSDKQNAIISKRQQSFEMSRNDLDQNPLYRSPMSEVAANPSRPSRPGKTFSPETHARRVSEQEIQHLVDCRAIQLLQVLCSVCMRHA